MVWSQELEIDELLNVMQLGVVVHGPDTSILQANPRALDMLNLTLDQALGKAAISANWHFINDRGEVMPPEDYPVNRVVRSGQPLSNYKVGIVDDHRPVPIWVSCNAYQSARDGRIVVTFIDITDTEAANRSLANSLEGEAQSKLRLMGTASRLEIALSAIKAHTYDLNVETGDIVFDDDFSPVLGYPADRLRRINLEQLGGLTHPGDLNKRSQGLHALLKGEISTYHNVARLKHQDGHWIWVENRSKVLERDTAGVPTHCVGVLIDITERKELESALLRNQKLEALGTLAGGIAHDFNNLLTPMLGYTELAKRQVPESSKVHSYLENVRKAAERSKQLVLNILLISRSGTSDKSPVSLPKLIEEVLVVVRASSPKGLVIHQEWSEDLPEIMADSAKIYQVILNLCTNAVQAMTDQGVLTITLVHTDRAPSIPGYRQSDEGYLRMSIEDNGSGIPPALLEQIFDPFFTTKLKGERRGTGLGLSIVDSVIKDHDGAVEVNSELGVGTRFEIYLPATSRPAAAESTIAVEQPVEQQIRVMLVDDEDMVRELGQSMLEQSGFEVTSFEDGWSALAAFSRHPEQFDVVLSDYEMPEVSGPELLSHLRKIRRDVPVVLLTGYANLATEEARSEYGFDAVLPKPYALDALQATVMRVLVRSVDDTGIRQ